MLHAWFRLVTARLLGVLRPWRRDREIDREIDAHLGFLAAEYEARGLSAEDARLAARKAFGSVDATRARYRDQGGVPFLDELAQDVRYGLRLMWRAPGTNGLAVATLALTIGTLTFVVSAANAILWRPLPVARPGAVRFVQAGTVGMSFPDYRDLRDRSGEFADLLAVRMAAMNVEHRGASSLLWGYLATGNYFTALGVQPAIGRFFTQAEDRTPGDAPWAVLSHDTWTARFGADPGVVGATIRVNGLLFTVLGVAPRGFYGTEVFYRPALWVPMMMQAQIEPGNDWLDARTTANAMVTAVIAPGVSATAAQGRLQAAAGTVASDHPRRNQPFSVRLTRPGLLGDTVGGPARAFFVGLIVLGAFLLAAGASNLAGLLLARGMDRGREIAMRAALGAGRARIVRQLMTEATLLSAAGGLAGMVIAWAATSALAARQMPVELPLQVDIEVDGFVAAVIAVVVLVLGVALAMAPARFAGRLDVAGTLKDGGSRLPGAGRGWHLRESLVAVQVALCCVLLHASFLSVRSWQRAIDLSIGWQPDRLVVGAVDLALAGYGDIRGRAYQERLIDEVSRLRNVTAVAIGNSLPLHIDQSISTTFADPPAADEAGDQSSVYEVSPRYFATIGMPLVAGRDFSRSDSADAPEVVIVNQTLASRLFGNPEAALGRRLRRGRGGRPLEIVGIVGDAKYMALAEQPRGALFIPLWQRYQSSTMVVARVSGESAATIGDLRRLIGDLDASVPIRMVAPAADLLAFPRFPYQAAAAALLLLGGIACGLLLTGVHGLLAYVVSRQQRELGIRLALGASRWAVLGSVLSRVGPAMATGLIAGLTLAVASGSLLSSVALDVPGADAAILGSLLVTLSVIAVLSCWNPIRRALRVDPVISLRQD